MPEASVLTSTLPQPPPISWKNSPNLASIPVFGGGSSILVVWSPDGTALEAKSVDVEDERWRRLPIPAGVKAVPFISSDTLALAYEGKAITQLAAFSADRGEWSIVQLEPPVQEAIAPALGHGCALYQAGDVFYAFSAQRGAWDVLHVPDADNENARATISAKYILVQKGNQLYVFGLKQGKWSHGVAMTLRPPTNEAAALKTSPAK